MSAVEHHHLRLKAEAEETAPRPSREAEVDLLTALNGGDPQGQPTLDKYLGRSGYMALFRWIDGFVLVCAGLLGLMTASAGNILSMPLGQALPWLTAPFAVMALFGAIGGYGFEHWRRFPFYLFKTAASYAFAALPVGGLAWLLGAAGDDLVRVGGGAGLALLANHAVFFLIAHRLIAKGALRTRIVVVGATPNASRLIEANAETGELEVIGVFDDRAGDRAPASIAGAEVVGTLDDLETWASLPEADTIVITVTSHAEARVRQLVERLSHLPNRIALFLDQDGFDPRQTSLAEIAGAPVAFVSGAPSNPGAALVKRASDLVIGGAALLLGAPLMAVIAVFIKLDSRGPVFYRQLRHGLNNSIIEVWKFRTMRAEESTRPTRQVVEDDPRVTRIGKFLRKTSLDELPQLFNVMKGEMSLVGPRPHALDMTTNGIESYRLVRDYAHRHRVKPGMTGLAAIRGSRGPLHTPESVRERIAHDVEYIDRRSLWLDLWIMAMTIPCLLGDRVAQR